MNLKKADNKGRVSGFAPNQLFRVTERSNGDFLLEPVQSYTRAELENATGRKFLDDEWGSLL